MDIPALAWAAAEIALAWEETTWWSGSKPLSTHSSPQPAPGSVRLPGGITLLGVRMRDAVDQYRIARPPRLPARHAPEPTGDGGSKSAELAEALAAGKKIVVCTIQTFHFAIEHLVLWAVSC